MHVKASSHYKSHHFKLSKSKYLANLWFNMTNLWALSVSFCTTFEVNSRFNKTFTCQLKFAFPKRKDSNIKGRDSLCRQPFDNCYRVHTGNLVFTNSRFGSIDQYSLSCKRSLMITVKVHVFVSDCSHEGSPLNPISSSQLSLITHILF